MTSDPILRQVYRAKDKLARKYGGDAHKLFEHLRKMDEEHPERLVTPPTKVTAPDKRRRARGKRGTGKTSK